ncbi:TVP38/TMEM64 family protein [Fodinisporobacter ferrooxydans]|uniref:TVP38/TMEM64 family membrane protein n=1 Tax=Fodinisporobacter ferrooxydans TaxID=2901836 RepID=A0ABY4CSC2_9BACL|nr:TVP38/TMEM64 family protein [Alicyclobacillaceae bacterium MYW30-H2]
MVKKFVTILICIGIVYLGFAHKAWFLDVIKAGGSFSIFMSMLFVSILVFFPVVPFVVVAGIIGATFGTWEGTAISVSGAMIGTLIMFWLARFGFSSWALATIEHYPKAKEYEAYFERYGFLSVFVARLIPIIPTPVVNILSGLSKISWITFFFASLLGKLPVNLVYNFAGSQLQSNKWLSILIYVIYALIIGVAAAVYKWKKMNPQS